jgi:hypothetical protein
MPKPDTSRHKGLGCNPSQPTQESKYGCIQMMMTIKNQKPGLSRCVFVEEKEFAWYRILDTQKELVK